MPQLSRRFVAHISGPLTHPGLGQPWPCGCGKTDNAADAAAARWWPLDALPDLAFDHAAIISAAWQQQSQASQR